MASIIFEFREIDKLMNKVVVALLLALIASLLGRGPTDPARDPSASGAIVWTTPTSPSPTATSSPATAQQPTPRRSLGARRRRATPNAPESVPRTPVRGDEVLPPAKGEARGRGELGPGRPALGKCPIEASPPVQVPQDEPAGLRQDGQ